MKVSKQNIKKNTVLAYYFDFKNYLDKIPNKEQYTLNTQTKAVSLLYEIDKKRKEYVEQIKNYIVELPNLIYLDTQENFYKSLYYFLKRQNMTIDEFLNKNGYQRTYNKQEVKFVNFEKEIEKKDVKTIYSNEPAKIISLSII